MGKKNKNKTVSASAADSAASTASSKSSKSKSSNASASAAPSSAQLDAASAAVFQSQLDKDALCKQFDYVIDSSPEEGIQAVRDLYINILKKKLTNDKRVQFLQSRTQELLADVTRHKKLIAEETDALSKTSSQKDKFQSLSDGLNTKKEALLQEERARVQAGKSAQQARTSDLIAETREISAKLERFSSLRQQYTEENNTLKDRLRVVLDDYSKQEAVFNAAMEKHSAKIAAARAMLEETTKQVGKDEQGVVEMDKDFEEMLKTEEQLRAELREKAGRFEEFQRALTQSNEAFRGFKESMEVKTVAIRALEKENGVLRAKKERTEQAIIDMTAEREKGRRLELEATRRQVQKLAGLCAALQAEVEQLSITEQAV